MKKIFCDECSKEINISFMCYETFLIDKKVKDLHQLGL